MLNLAKRGPHDFLTFKGMGLVEKYYHVGPKIHCAEVRKNISKELLEVDSDDVCTGLVEEAWFGECKARRGGAKYKS